MPLFPYPTDLGSAPLELLTELRSGNPLSAHGVHAAAHLAMYSLGTFYPDDSAPIAMAKACAGAKTMTHGELCDCLDSMSKPDVVKGWKDFDWAALLKTLLPLILSLFA